MPATRRARKDADVVERHNGEQGKRARRRQVEDPDVSRNSTYAIAECEGTMKFRDYGSLVVDEDNEVLYVIGGADRGQTCADFHAYYFQNCKWEDLTNRVRDAFQNVVRPLPHFTNASAALWSDGSRKSIMLFGGHRQWGTLTNEVVKIDLDDLSWCILPISGNSSPQPCQAATMIIVGDELFLFGGIPQTEEYGGTHTPVYSKAKYSTVTKDWTWELTDKNIDPNSWPVNCNYIDGCLMYYEEKVFFVGGFGNENPDMPRVSTSSASTFMYDIQADIFFPALPGPKAPDATLNAMKADFAVLHHPLDQTSIIVVCWILQNDHDPSSLLVPQFWRISKRQPETCRRLLFRHDLADEELDWKFPVSCGTSIYLFGYDNTKKGCSDPHVIVLEHHLEN